MKRKLYILVVAFLGLLLAFCLLHFFVFKSAPSVDNSGGLGNPEAIAKGQREALILRGLEIAKHAPRTGSEEFISWYKSLSKDDSMAWSAAHDEQEARPESHGGEAKIKIEPWGMERKHVFSMKMLTNFKPSMRVAGNFSVRPLQIETVKSGDRYLSTIWARRAEESIVVDWDSGSVTKGSVDTATEADGPSPQYLPGNMFLSSIEDRLEFKNKDTSFSVKWDPNIAVYPLILDENYKYAFGVQRNDQKKTAVDGIVVLDVEKKEVADIINIPSAPMSVHVVFKPKDGYLLILDSDWQWILFMDLRKSKEPKK